jgi:hypothetical protein
MKARSQLLALVLIGFLAAALRLIGTNWGEPYGYHYDEPFVIAPALRIVSTGDLNPHFFRYPSALIYAEAAVVAALHRWTGLDLSLPVGPAYGPVDLGPWTWPALLGGRWLVAASGTIGVLGAAFLGFRLAGVWTALTAAAFVAVAPLHVEHSHYLTTDVPSTTFMTLALALGCGQQTALLWRFLAGLFLGIAIGTKYTTAFALPALVVIVFLATRERRVRTATVVAMAVALGFFSVCPFSLLDARGFIADLQGVRSHYQGGHLGAEGDGNWGWYLVRLYQDGAGPAGLGLLVAGLIAALAAIRSRWPDPASARVAGLVLITALAWFAALGAVRVRFERNLLPALTLAWVIAAYGLAFAAHAMRNRWARGLMGSATALALLSCLWLSARASIRMARGDTRDAALSWIDRNIPPGALLVREEFTPRPDPTRYRVEYVWSLAQHDPQWYLDRGVDYVIASRSVYGRFQNAPGPGNDALRTYRALFSHPRAAIFVPGEQRAGPIIAIHAIARPDPKP